MTTTTATPIKPGWRVPDCPPSTVHDQLVQWFEVAGGELVLHGGQLHQLEHMWPAMRGNGSEVGVILLREGSTSRHYVDSNAWTAVRRYEVG